MDQEIKKLLNALNSGAETVEIKSIVDLFIEDKPYQFYNIEKVT